MFILTLSEMCCCFKTTDVHRSGSLLIWYHSRHTAPAIHKVLLSRYENTRNNANCLSDKSIKHKQTYIHVLRKQCQLSVK